MKELQEDSQQGADDGLHGERGAAPEAPRVSVSHAPQAGRPPVATAEAVRQFRSFFEVFDAILPYYDLDETAKKYINQKREWVERLEQADFPVAFLGTFSAGKSTIINAIVGREVLPESVDATTAVPTLIRKGATDGARIYFIDEKGKAELWSQLCAEVGEKIGADLGARPQEDRAAHFGRIKAAVREYEQKTNSQDRQVEAKPLQALEQLLRGWDEHKAESRAIALSELKRYVDKHPDVLFIDRIEAYVQDIDVPEDVVLVDLPGLAVANARHRRFTKEYIEQRAKAFVVCMKAKHLLEGEELLFLEETNRRNPSILQRSFWVLNQWDALDQHQRAQQLHGFREAVRLNAFNITEKRFFKFSALNYFLLTAIADGALDKTEQLKSHLDNLSRMTAADFRGITAGEAAALLRHEDVAPFREFRAALFKYLNTTAKDEFIANARKELAHITEDIRRLLEPASQLYSRNGDVAEEVRTAETYAQLNAFLDGLKERLDKFTSRVRGPGWAGLWTDAHTTQIGQDINETILRLDRNELEQELLAGLDTGGMIYRLPTLLEERLQISRLLREKLVALVGDNFGRQLHELLTELKELNRDYLPDAVLESLEDKLGQRDLAMRLNGLADSLFFDYGEMFDRIGDELKECQGETFEDRLGAALDKYQQAAIVLTKELVSNLDRRVQRSVKNHAETLSEELVRIFHAQEASILSHITRRLSVRKTVALEMQKRDTIRNGYAALTNLSDELRGAGHARAPEAA